MNLTWLTGRPERDGHISKGFKETHGEKILYYWHSNFRYILIFN